MEGAVRLSRLPALAACAAVAFGAAASVGATPSPSPTGLWLTQGRDGVIDIEACGLGLCGTIVGTSTPGQCRLTIMNVDPAPDGRWAGHITDPRNGSVWNAELWQERPDILKLRGYVVLPLLGQTQIWTRYTGRLTADCRMR